MKRFWVAAAAGFAAAVFVLVGCGERSLEMVKAEIRRKYPKVRTLSTADLALELDQGRELVLLDVRTAGEFAVSHLPGARQVDPGAETIQGLARDAEIVTYCSVGYRSAGLAEKLREQGFANVRNLEGSIFAWFNEGRPVYRKGKRVAEVHPYDAMWGQLLQEKRL